MSDTVPVKIGVKIGGLYRTRGGHVVECVGMRDPAIHSYPARCQFVAPALGSIWDRGVLVTYRLDGVYDVPDILHQLDIIKEIKP